CPDRDCSTSLYSLHKEKKEIIASAALFRAADFLRLEYVNLHILVANLFCKIAKVVRLNSYSIDKHRIACYND
ncbi:MAG: hypothetical protein J6S28_04585, partial [Clostridia bacterium]|nr:hypothetical protein [Clostridia bacterium]